MSIDNGIGPSFFIHFQNKLSQHLRFGINWKKNNKELGIKMLEVLWKDYLNKWLPVNISGKLDSCVPFPSPTLQ